MRTIKFRGRAFNDTHWMFATPDSDSWEQFWIVTRKETRGQFTGLLDKNDKEIFEGDIIEIRGTYYDTRREPVIFDMHAFMAGGRFLADFGNYFSLEIIGNIYENPELLQ